MLLEREKTKRRTFEKRRLQHAKAVGKDKPDPPLGRILSCSKTFEDGDRMRYPGPGLCV